MNDLVKLKDGKAQYAQGYRYAVHWQYGDTYLYKENPERTGWGSGLYRLNEDGKLGECLHFNYDSSD